MKKICFIFMLLLCLKANAQWKYANFPLTGDVREILNIPNTNQLFAIVSGIVFRSDDKGNTWIRANNGLPGYMLCLSAVGNTIFAGSFQGLFYTTDMGNQWKVVSSFPDTVSVITLINRGNTLYAGTDGYAIFQSNDTGSTWSSTHNLPIDASVYSFFIKDSFLFTAGLEGVHRSVDGYNWKRVSKQLIRNLSATRKALFASTISRNYISFDYGDNWKQLEVNWDYTYCLGATDSMVFYGTDKGIFCSKDNGTSWTQLKNGLPLENHANVFTNTAGGMFMGTTKGMFFSDDEGMNWTNRNKGLAVANVKDLENENDLVFAGTDEGMFISGDEGKTWNLKQKGFSNEAIIEKMAKNDTGVFVVTNSGILKSLDHGETWEDTGNNLPTGLGYTNMAIEEETLILGGYWDGIFRSSNNGRAWEDIINNLPPNSQIVFMAMDATNLFVFTVLGELYLSKDKGDTWALIPHHANMSYITSLKIIDKVLYMSTGKGLYASSDEGSTWIHITNGIPADAFISCVESIGKAIIAGGNATAWVKEENALSWQSIPDGLPEGDIKAFSLSGNTLFAGIERNGVWARPLKEIMNGIEKNKHEHLFTIYPNPGKGLFTISSTTSHVQIKVFNSIGENVFQGYANDSIFQLNLQELAKGIYVVNLLTSDGRTTSQKVLIQD